MIHRPYKWIPLLLLVYVAYATPILPYSQSPLTDDSRLKNNREISSELFADLEELSRVVDIAYCVGLAGIGIQKPFQCASRCHEFKSFRLVTVGMLGTAQANKAH
jgi:hypothetical protein